MIVWFTGQPGHGKTTLAKLLQGAIPGAVIIDGDELRKVFKNQDYSKVGRIKNVRQAQSMAEMLHNQGKFAIVAMVSPYRDMREEFKSKMKNHVLEAYVTCDEPRERDHLRVEGYEAPKKDFITVNTSQYSARECVERILFYL